MSSMTRSLNYLESSASFNTAEAVRAANWAGSIPVVVTLAPSSLSSPTLPPPIHVLLSRHTYLHVGLKSVVERLYQFAPNTLSFAQGMVRTEPEAGHDEINDDIQNKRAALVADSTNPTERSTADSPFAYPVCWFEDEETRMALRWQMFVGVLFDLRNTKAMLTPSHQQSCSSATLPWRIRLHFTSYPTSQILPIEQPQRTNSLVSGPPDAVFAFYRNSLKQALCLQCGHNKVALNVSRDSHGRLWDSICHTNYSLWRQVQSELEVPTLSTNIPVASATRSPLTATSKHASPSKLQITAGAHLLPIRLIVNERPPMQKRWPALRVVAGQVEATPTTLGQILVEWVPEYFAHDDRPSGSSSLCNNNINESRNTDGFECRSARTKASALVRWTIAGLSQVPLDFPLHGLWLDLCHPDLFLYIVVFGA